MNKKRKNIEDQMCRGFWKGFQYKYPNLVSVTTHFPAGGLRNSITGAALKSMGTQAGFPDYQIMFPCGGFHGLFLEFKVDKNKLTGSQLSRMMALHNNHYACAVVRSTIDAYSVIDLYLEYKYFPNELKCFEYR